MVGEKFVRVRETRIDLRILSWYYCYDLIKMFMDYISGDAYNDRTGRNGDAKMMNRSISCVLFI